MTEKACFRCKRFRPLEEFYRHARMADGHLGKCKECTKGDTRQRYAEKRSDQAFIDAERERGRGKYHRLYRGQKRSRDRSREKGAHPEHRRARLLVQAAVQSGRLVKPDRCQACGREASGRELQAHHDDHSKPFEVRWLCTECHAVEDRPRRQRL